MSPVFGKEVAWKQINILTAFGTLLGLDPKEVFDGGSSRTAEKALCSIEVAYFRLEIYQHTLRGPSVLPQINVFDLFPNDPVGHWVYVVTQNVTPKSIGLKKRRAATHKRVRNALTSKLVRLVEQF
jgi:hypothetical protein